MWRLLQVLCLLLRRSECTHSAFYYFTAVFMWNFCWCLYPPS